MSNLSTKQWQIKIGADFKNMQEHMYWIPLNYNKYFDTLNNYVGNAFSFSDVLFFTHITFYDCISLYKDNIYFKSE